MLISNYSTLQFGTEIEAITNISLIVESFEKPEVLWLFSLGGKLGVWKVNNTIDEPGRYGVYFLSSTIVPLKHNHFGNYSLRIRNSAGKADVIITIGYTGMFTSVT